MKYACIANMAFANVKNIAEENITKKNVRICHAKTKLTAVKDTPNHAKNLSLQIDADLAATDYTNIQSS